VRERPHRLAAAVAAVALAAGCSAGAAGPEPLVSGLGSGQYAVLLTDSSISTTGVGQGALAVVDSDRVVGLTRTSGAVDPVLDARDGTVVFSTATTDYLLTAQALTGRPRTDAGGRLAAVTDKGELRAVIGSFGLGSGSAVTVFNVGINATGRYETWVVSFSRDAPSAVSVVESYVSVVGRCGEAVIGLGGSPEAAGPDRILDLTAGSATSRAATGVPADLATFDPVAPCVDDVLYVLEESSTGVDAQGNPIRSGPMMGAWDTRTGRHTTVPLLLSGDAPVGHFIDTEGRGTLPAGRLSLVDGTAYWMTQDGSVFAADPRTGATRRVMSVDVARDEDEVGPTLSLHGATLISARLSNGRLDLERFDLRTGRSVDRRTGIEIRGTGGLFVGDVLHSGSA
jgi:hypothetical protein